MKNNNTSVKIILIIFFIIFFGFLFYYFYESTDDEKKVEENSSRFLDNLFPFSENDTENIEDKKFLEDDYINQNIKQETEKKIPRLRQISKIPTAAVHIEKISKLEIFDLNKDRKNFEKLDEEEVYSEIRYISIKNNHIYQTYNFTENENRISNVTIAKIIEADFFDKNNFFIRYQNEFNNKKTYMASLYDKKDEEKNQEENKNLSDKYLKKFQGIFFPDDIENLYINKKNGLVFYTTLKNTKNQIDGQLHGIITNKESENKKEIFSSDLKEWNFYFNNEDKIFVSTKNSTNSDSIAFSLDTKKGTFLKISKSKIGLNGLPNNDFSKILYSYKNDLREYVLVVEDVKTKEKKEFRYSTFVEKCVWSNDNINFYCGVPRDIFEDNNQPDFWYKGKNNFRDDILKINSETGDVEFIFNAVYEGKYFDIIDLKIDDREKYLYWKNKINNFAWSYDLFY